jgi:hypothetical protein
MSELVESLVLSNLVSTAADYTSPAARLHTFYIPAVADGRIAALKLVGNIPQSAVIYLSDRPIGNLKPDAVTLELISCGTITYNVNMFKLTDPHYCVFNSRKDKDDNYGLQLYVVDNADSLTIDLLNLTYIAF